MVSVRFVRADGMPDEVYYYHNQKDAEEHLTLFRTDDSGLYQRIDLVLEDGSIEKTIDTIHFE